VFALRELDLAAGQLPNRDVCGGSSGTGIVFCVLLANIDICISPG
jgi:hypothetical protein